jgi:hypothetical protein
MNVAEIESLFAHVRDTVGGFPAGMEDGIAHFLNGFRVPVAEEASQPEAQPQSGPTAEPASDSAPLASQAIAPILDTPSI